MTDSTTTPVIDVRTNPLVATAWTDPSYPASAPYHPGQTYPEYSGPVSDQPNQVYDGVRSILRDLGLDRRNFGDASWNPIGDLVAPGARIVIKPNWVLHENEGVGGLECLYTHASVVRAIIDYALKARPAQIVVGDAPIQVCQLPKLLAQGYDQLFAYYQSLGASIVVKDFRRTVSERKPGALAVQDNLKPVEDYVLVDLAEKSLLEPISDDAEKFRVTMYDPRHLMENHAPGRHRYLVARDILEADLVINVPKLKTHKKAGVTLALKNLVGINGSKEFLPHHRKGGADRGGDNYDRNSLPKRTLENILDWLNRHLDKPHLYGHGARLAYKLLYFDKIRGRSIDVEGGWYGNDTVWRMCLDLNKILLFADTSGKLHEKPQRVTLHITDGIIAGEGDGPLRPDPVRFGALIGAVNPAAHDWVITRLMGFDPQKIPIVRHAFHPTESGITQFVPGQIQTTEDNRAQDLDDLATRHPVPFKPAYGWRGHVEFGSLPSRPSILHIVHHDGPGGGPPIIVSLLRYLSEWYDQSVAAGGRGLVADYCAKNNLPYHDLRFTKASTWIAAAPTLWRLLRKQRPDIVVLHGQPAGPVGALMARLAGCRNIVYVAQWPAFYTDWDMFRILRNRICESLPCRLSNRVVTFTAGSRHQFALRKLAPDHKLICIPPSLFDDELPNPDAVTEVRRRHGWLDGLLHVVSVGRLSDQKCVDQLLQSWREVTQQLPESRLWIVGDGPERAGLEELAAKLNITSSCRFLGYQPDGRTFIAAADLLVITSMYESFGYVAVEGCACGTPIVASRVNGIEDIIHDRVEGHLVPPGDTTGMAARIVDLLRNPEQRRAMGEAGRRRAAQFQPARIYPAWRELIEHLLAEKKHS